MNVTYFLFGIDACQILLHEGQEKFLEWAKEETEFSVFRFEENFSHPIDLLNSYDGWGEFSAITEELFNKIQEL
jgi:hypothetical protein